jgi:hypothetical protein
MYEKIDVRYPINTLVSYHYWKKRDLSILKNNGLNVIGDSGAFSAMTQGTVISVTELGEWGVKWKDDLAWCASLDVIGNQKQTYKNYKQLRTDFDLEVIPTVHYGANPNAIDKYVADGVDYIGLGGMVAYKSEPSKLLRWCLSMFKYAQDTHPQVRFHGWGITHKDLLLTLPWYSVDSTGWAYSFMLGRHTLWIPPLGKFIRFATDGKEAFKYGDLIRRYYNVEPAVIARSTKENYYETVRVSARSYQLLEDHLRKRYHVTAPNYGLKPNAPVGVNIHLANGSNVIFEKYLAPIRDEEVNV